MNLEYLFTPLKDLLAHFGCVNAVEFSEDGELLATGGDDKRVLCWNLDQAVFSHEAAGAGFKNNYKPAVMSAEHESNIFCISFDSAKSQVNDAPKSQLNPIPDGWE